MSVAILAQAILTCHRYFASLSTMPRGSRSLELQVEQEDDDVGHHHSLTVSAASESPRAIMALNGVNQWMIHKRVAVRPYFKTEMFDCRAYTMLYYRPHRNFITGEPFPCIQRMDYHTTLCVGYWPEERQIISWRDLSGLASSFEAWRRFGEINRLEKRMQQHYERELWWAVGAPLELVESPFVHTWTFGIGEPWNALNVALQERSEEEFRWVGIRPRRRRPLHISWR